MIAPADGEDGEEDGVAHPRRTAALFGQDAAEAHLLQMYRSGRMPHAWLIGGPPGIGKATLAFRLARFLFAHPDPRARAVTEAATLAVDRAHPVFGLVKAQSHPDLVVLERTVADSGKLRSVIRVEEVRRVPAFLGATAALGGWRVVIVDAVDDLNAEGSNTLLKGLEEPPEKTLFLLVSHAPGAVLATIRSRCQRLILRPLDDEALAHAVETVTGARPEPALIAAAEGSVSRALSLLEGPAFKLRQQTMALLSQLPDAGTRDLHALADGLAGADPKDAAVAMEAINDWLSARLHRLAADGAQAALVAHVWQEVNAATRNAEVYNLDRKPLIFRTFGLLAAAARG